MSELNTNLDWALMYAKKGWKIFPLFYVLKDGTCSCRDPKCKRIGKHPVVKNGLLVASSEERQVREWWNKYPHANIRLATGHNGLVVMDIDISPVYKDGKFVRNKEGVKHLTELVATYRDQNGPLPDTLKVTTGSGGTHYWFLSIHPIPNSQDKVAPDIDIRGQGGYVILPPSNHKSGKKYEWQTGPDGHIADCPPWLEARAMPSAKEVSSIIGKDTLDEAVVEEAKKKEPIKLSPDQLVQMLQYIPADCDRDTWWKIGAALKKELGETKGFEVFDEWSRKAPDKYDAKNIHVQWNSFQTDKGITGGTIAHYAKEAGFRGFDVEAADAPEIREKWIFIAGIKRFVEIERLTEWDREQFDMMHLEKFTRGRPSDHVLKNPNFRKVHAPTYWPNQEQFCTEAGTDKFNYWRPANVTPRHGDVTPFLEHVKYLYPNPEESGVLLSYLAFQVQHPGEKVHWAILLEGEQGNGKSYFAGVMKLVLGEHNVRTVSNDALHETFTGWQKNTQFIIVEEMMARARLELMNKLKPMITEPWCEIREMYRPPYTQANRFNFLFFSNHADSIIIDSTDRRYCILKTNSPPHPDRNAYYGPLFDWTRHHAPELLHYLQNYDLSGFQAKAHAPMTEGKRQLIITSMLPVDQYIHDKVSSQEWPFNIDLVDPALLVEVLSKYNLRVNPKEITNSLRRLGYTDLSPTGARLWAVRNGGMYAKMEGDQLRNLWASIVRGEYSDSATDPSEFMRGRPDNPLMKGEAM